MSLVRLQEMNKGLMGGYGYGVVLILVLLPFSLGASAEQLSSRECENLGFTGLALCSDCNTLSDYVKDKGQYVFDLSLSLNQSIIVHIRFCFVFFIYSDFTVIMSLREARLESQIG